MFLPGVTPSSAGKCLVVPRSPVGAVAVPTTVSPGAQTQASSSLPCSQAGRSLRSTPASCADAEAAAVVLYQKGAIPPALTLAAGWNCGGTVPCQPVLQQRCHTERPRPCGAEPAPGHSTAPSALGWLPWAAGRGQQGLLSGAGSPGTLLPPRRPACCATAGPPASPGRPHA